MLKKEISVFFVVGLSTVLVDFVIYFLLICLQLVPSNLAKIFSFVSGTIYSYWANKSWTFNEKKIKISSVLKFAFLYSIALCLNVLINSQLLEFFKNSDYALQISFFFATSVSASVNFVGMKLFVFKTKTES